MGLAQQVAYSSLLAFFPAVIFLVGLLGLIGAYDQLQSFLNPIAPRSVTDTIKQLQHDSKGGGSVIAVVAGAFGALWAARERQQELDAIDGGKACWCTHVCFIHDSMRHSRRAQLYEVPKNYLKRESW